MSIFNRIPTFETPGAAWRFACNQIEQFGSKVVTEDGQTTKEIMNLALQVVYPTLGWPIAGSGWDLPALEIYFKYQILGTDNSTGFSYIYGQRIVPHLSGLIQKLQAEPTSRRAVISLWQDSDYEIEHPPCWMVLEFLVRSEQLNLTAFIRSNDIKQAWPANVYGLSRLMTYVSEQLGDVEVGTLTTFSTSAHIYER